MDKKYTILAIDDTIANLKFLELILGKIYNFKATPNANLAVEFINNTPPDLILLDIKMPDIDGYTLCKEIKKNSTNTDIPIIFISGFDDIDHKVKAFENGGVDYITKPFEAKEVEARVKTQIELYTQKQQINQLLEHQDLFIKKIMHELNTPASIISLNCEALERQFGQLSELNSIKASTKTLSSIYADITYLVKHEPQHYQIKQINMIEFINQRIQFFDELAKVKDIFLEFITDNELYIDCNDYELERIIDNTLSNAIKYSKPSSIITIELTNNRLIIQDEGIGMQDPKAVFHSYYQDTKTNIGLGLGLAIVFDICKKYDITIDIQSELNIGATITYDFSSIKAQL